MERKELLRQIEMVRQEMHYQQEQGNWEYEFQLLNALLQLYETLFRELYEETFNSKESA